MKGSAFFKAAVPDPHVILGVKLRPFSLGHLILLQRLECAFVTGAEPTLNDLVCGVFVCAQTWEDNAAWLHTGTVRREFGPLSWRESKDRFMARWQRKLGLFDFDGRSAAFGRYLHEGSAPPEYDFNPGNSQPVECPTAQIVKIHLLRYTSLTESEILNRPWALCQWDYISLKALDGHVRFVSHENLTEQRKAADAFAALIEGGARATN